MNKTIAVIGANGKSGQAFVRAALEAGYLIRAGIHKNNTLSPHENLEVVPLNSVAQQDIITFVKGCDYVVSLIGHGKTSPKWLQSDTMEALVHALNTKTPLISLTGTGVRYSGDKITFGDRLIHLLLKIIMRDILNDGIRHARVLEESKLNFTIVRALVLTTSDARPYRLTKNGPAAFFVPRETVANAILEIIEQSSFTREAPIISKP